MSRSLMHACLQASYDMVATLVLAWCHIVDVQGGFATSFTVLITDLASQQTFSVIFQPDQLFGNCCLATAAGSTVRRL